MCCMLMLQDTRQIEMHNSHQHVKTFTQQTILLQFQLCFTHTALQMKSSMRSYNNDFNNYTYRYSFFTNTSFLWSQILHKYLFVSLPAAFKLKFCVFCLLLMFLFYVCVFFCLFYLFLLMLYSTSADGL